MPQNALLKRQACFEFLLRHSRQTANEIKDEYVDTMSKVHTTYFKTYLHRLLKLQVCAVSCSPISSLAKTTCCLCLRQRLFFFFSGSSLARNELTRAPFFSPSQV